MKRHLRGKRVRGDANDAHRCDEYPSDTQADKLEPTAVREADWRELAHAAKLGARPHPAEGARARFAQDRRLESEHRHRSTARVAVALEWGTARIDAELVPTRLTTISIVDNHLCADVYY